MPPLLDLTLLRVGGLMALLACLSACAPLPPAPDAPPSPPAAAPAPPVAAPPPASMAADALPRPAPLPPQPLPALREPADLVARQVAAASERMRALGNAELVKEIVRLSEGPPSPATTLEMALGLGLTRNPGDLARATGLLDPIARSNSPELAPWQPWARLLLSRYAEHRRAEEQLERQGQQLREQQRRIDQLNNQVEALKAIERSMAPRPAAQPPATPPVTRSSPP